MFSVSWIHYLLLMALLLTCWTWIFWSLMKDVRGITACYYLFTGAALKRGVPWSFALEQKFCLRSFSNSGYLSVVPRETTFLNKLPWWFLYALIFENNDHKENTLKYLHSFKGSLCAASFQTVKVSVSQYKENAIKVFILALSLINHMALGKSSHFYRLYLPETIDLGIELDDFCWVFCFYNSIEMQLKKHMSFSVPGSSSEFHHTWRNIKFLFFS